VWIDFFAGRKLWHATSLEQFILENEDLALCGIILTKILQGIADDNTHGRVRRFLRPLIMLPLSDALFVHAADIYRRLRKHGITIRKTNDCIIAATALDYHCELLRNDKDFTLIAEHYPLKIVTP